MTHEERVKRVVGFGFTHRQAAFLVEVMLHSGFFLGRQYCTFARIARGQKLVDFLEKLTTRRLATPYLCGHNKARVYHLHNTTLYDAIEQRDVRFRKRMALGRALERLMILDHVITHREFRWLGSEQDKVAHFLTTTSLDRDALPRLAFGVKPNITVRYFPDKLPIGVSPDGRTHAFLYLLVNPLPHDFRVFLRRHAELLRALPAWSIQLLVPVEQTDSEGRAQRPCRPLRERLSARARLAAGSRHRERAAVVLGGQHARFGSRRGEADATGASHLRDAAVSSTAPSIGTRWRARGRRRHVEESGRRHRAERRTV